MYANYDFISECITVYTDFDAFLAQLSIENALDKDIHNPKRSREYIHFVDLPPARQDVWKPVLEGIFRVGYIFSGSESNVSVIGNCNFSVKVDGACTIRREGKNEAPYYVRVYNEFTYTNRHYDYTEAEMRWRDDDVLMLRGVNLQYNEYGLVDKRERIQIIDTLLLDL